jgi:hypothetical protein
MLAPTQSSIVANAGLYAAEIHFRCFAAVSRIRRRVVSVSPSTSKTWLHNQVLAFCFNSQLSRLRDRYGLRMITAFAPSRSMPHPFLSIYSYGRRGESAMLLVPLHSDYDSLNVSG